MDTNSAHFISLSFRFTTPFHAAVNVWAHLLAHQCIDLMLARAPAYVTAHSSAQKVGDLIPHYVNAYVIQMVYAHLVRLSMALHASVYVIHSNHVVRDMSLIRILVAAFVRTSKNVQMVMFTMMSHVSVCVKAAHLRTSGMNDIMNAGKITIRCLASSRVAASVQSTYSVQGRELLTQILADVCAPHLLVPAQR